MKKILLFLLLSTSLFAKSDMPLVYLTWHNDPNTTMCIKWITNDQDTTNRVSYAQKKKDAPWIQVEASNTAVPIAPNHLLHTIELQNLLPDTKYQFRIGSNKTPLYFRTMPLDLTAPIRFIAGADANNGHQKRFRAMCQQAAKQNPRFAIIGGDIAYSIPHKDKEVPEDFSRWKNFFRCWSEEMKTPDGCIIPLFTSIGNHEAHGKNNPLAEKAPLFYTFFDKGYYDFGFGNYAHFTFLDSGHTNAIKGKQTDWLKTNLQNHKYFLHRFVTYHVGAYPSTGKFNDHLRKAVREHWVPLFEKYRIHACFEGHDHAYKRTHPLKNGKIDPSGVVYFGDGSWGVSPRAVKHAPYIATAKASQQVLVVELSNLGRKFWAIDPDGKLIDYYEQNIMSIDNLQSRHVQSEDNQYVNPEVTKPTGSINEIIHAHWEAYMRSMGLDPNNPPPPKEQEPFQLPRTHTCGHPYVVDKIEQILVPKDTPSDG